ncbi:MAG: hypothetical protein LLG37_05055 [Spirochaetia bacterium]|nr:hypothetical protein [Spirochaetia bacterium]
MEDNRNGATEAQLQIERLKKMKEQKDAKEKLRKEMAFSFPEHAEAQEPEKMQESAGGGQFIPAEVPHAVTVKKTPAKKHELSARIDRKNLDRIKKAVKKIKEQNGELRLSEDMLINMILARVLELGIDWGTAKSAEDIRYVLARIKAEQ